MSKNKTKAEIQIELDETKKELNRLKGVEKKYKDSQNARWKLNKQLEETYSADYVKTLKDQIASLKKGDSDEIKKRDKEIKDLKAELGKRVPQEEMDKFNRYIDGLQPILNEYISAYQNTLKSIEGTLELAKQSEKDIRQKFGGNK